MSVVMSRRCFITPAAAAAGLPPLLKAGGAQARMANPAGLADGLFTAMLMAPGERLKAAGGEKAIYVAPEGVVSTVEA